MDMSKKPLCTCQDIFLEQPKLLTGRLKGLVHKEAAVVDITEYSKAFRVLHNAVISVIGEQWLEE